MSLPDRLRSARKKKYPSARAAAAAIEARTRITSGDIVVVERRRNGELETTLNRVEAMPGRYELRPNSTDPRYKEPLIVIRDHAADDGLEVEIRGLVIGVFSPR